MRTDRDKTLLFAILAVQIHGLTAQQVIEHAAAWMVEPGVSLPQRLADAGLLTQADVASLELLVGKIAISSEGLADTILSQAYPPGRTSTPQAPHAGAPHTLDSAEIGLIQEAAGRYADGSELGRGALGKVLLVTDRFLGRDVVLKELIRPDTSGAVADGDSHEKAAALLARFVLEARIVGQLGHACIVPVYEMGHREDGTLYYTMRFVRGKSLDAALREQTTLDRRIGLLPHVLNMCHTLAYAHERGVIHRDVRPSNVMVGDYGETVLLSWSLARIQGENDPHDGQSTLSMQTLRRAPGTLSQDAVDVPAAVPNHMPPEQAEEGLSGLDERSDVYAVGTLLYALLTGRAPYEGLTADEVLRQLPVRPPEPVAAYEPDAPAELVRICEKAMRHNPGERYPSMIEMRDALLRFQTQALVQTYRIPASRVFYAQVQKHWLAVAVIAVSVIAMAAVSVCAVIGMVQARDFERTARIAAEAARDAAVRVCGDAEAQRRTALRQQYLAQLRLAQAHVLEQRMVQANAVLDAAPEAERDWVWSYVRSRANPASRRLNAGPSGLQHAVFAPSGDYIAGLRPSGAPCLWNAVTGDWVLDFASGSGDYVSAAFEPTGARFAALGAGGHLEVWEVGTGELVHTLAHPSDGTALTFSRDGQRAWVGYGDGAAVEWELASGTARQTLYAGGAVTALAPLHEAGLLLVSTEGGTLQAHAVDDGGMRYRIEAEAVWPLPDGRRFLSSQSPELRLHDAATGEVLQSYPDMNGCRWVVFHPDGRQFLAAGASGIALGRLDASMPLQAFKGTKPCTYSHAYFLDDGRRVLGCAASSEFTLWDTETFGIEAEFSGDASESIFADLSPDGRWLLASAGPGGGALYDLRHPCQIDSLAAVFRAGEHDGCLHAIDWSASAGRAALLSEGGVLRVVDLRTLETLARVEVEDTAPRLVALDADGASMLYARNARTLVVANADTGSEVLVYDGHQSDVRALGFSPDGVAAVSAGGDGGVQVWRTGDGTVISDFHAASEVNGLAHDGFGIALACADGSLRLHDAESGAQKLAIDAHDTAALNVVWSPSGETLASVASHGEVALWDAQSGETRGAWQFDVFRSSPAARRYRVRFTPDGRYLLASGECSPTAIIDTLDGEVVMTTREAQQVAVLDDGATMISVLPSGAIQRQTFSAGR